LALLTSLADSFFQSWSYWQFKFYNDITTQGPEESFYDSDGNLETDKVKTLSRSYAQAIAGIPIIMSFDPETSNFILTYQINPSIEGPTEIYINEDFYYSNGFGVSITPSNAATWKRTKKNHVEVYATKEVVKGQTVTINIRKNSV